ncbi:MAG: hypothetical protein UW68_C0001G0050 [Candidatus Collierbacteria bacterium GW2011_GWB1_44_6]|uniref:Uncharacterized protein n=2 Tax=Candidatus Collieribacteriota TaxID=1752725 RepID=A0A0G1MP96_9BACT|nr:MAG: hypothetical protein UV68_C0001G0022 [Candidatus Collierbacteria bacterium GW2011_GWC2_43_12]KKT73854.1 MAG: hypothetical protein UW68_C0001G0050 [Candidatus Collierbacteria bacterium GW2011_GWB1_44_6]KKT84142.1 MAG: hypothetical protein UW80_C0001G0022 [Microgenomates group bacterium GW2011_GWC1_44_9]
MAKLIEKLTVVYCKEPKKDEPRRASWIPQKLSENPRSQFLDEQTLLAGAKLEIIEIVETHLLDTYGPREIDTKLAHFYGSFDKLYQRHGAYLVKALSELLDGMKFVGHDGFIRKVIVRDKVVEIRKREKNQ